MIKHIFFTLSLLAVLAAGSPAHAVDINLINVDMSPDDNSRLANAYGQAYGYPPQQVMPAMYGPPQEVPAIMQIAQAAGQVPMTIWMMRRMGMNYSSILSTFALAPTVLAGGPMGSPYGYPGYGMPSRYWGRWTDPFYVQTARVNFLRNVLGVPANMLPYIPAIGVPFAKSLLYPYHPVHGTWMPPGIAKKYGLWIPPGQRKKIGWGPWGEGPSWKHGHKGWDHDDWKGDDWKHGGPGGGQHGWKYNDDGDSKGKSGKGGAEDGNKGNGGSRQKMAQGNGSSKDNGSSKGNGGSSKGGSGKGGAKGGNGGGMGKGKNK